MIWEESQGGVLSATSWDLSPSAYVGVTAVTVEDSQDTSLILGNLENATTSHSGVDSRNYQFHNHQPKHRACPYRTCTYSGLAGGFPMLHWRLFAKFSFLSCMALEVGLGLRMCDLVQSFSLLTNLCSLHVSPRPFWLSQGLREDTAQPLIFSLSIHRNEKNQWPEGKHQSVKMFRVTARTKLLKISQGSQTAAEDRRGCCLQSMFLIFASPFLSWAEQSQLRKFYLI